MSLGIAIKGSEGIVLAADSRLTLGAGVMLPNPQNPQLMQLQQIFVNFDNATKLISLGKPNEWIGAVTFGDAVIGTTAQDLRTAQSFIPEFEQSLPQKRQTTKELADRLSGFFMERWKEKGMPDAAAYPGQGMSFVVGGYDPDKAYGSIFTFNVPKAPSPVEQAPNDFGISFGGQGEHTIRLIQGYDPRVLQIAKQVCNLSDQQIDALKTALLQLMLSVPYGILPLQDCIDMAVFLIHTTVAAQQLSVGIRGVGGVIEVAVITRREPLRFIQRKELIVGTART